ncbi:glycosyl hydrolase family 76 [Colletotrichum karsti]|uniref:mannan endo-1,6-alpha-mannosidase n=1 Tax=Colletotrichum karsti TaxID=1095194 RepID=A0A9P6IBZ2_9PEZI|nr:glycosyl hydrolase family 76 [Colletotrichum karsti]KAF9880808.1 glycosyl hydrolase family 76 [Colletotrichum karsti]
MKTSFVASAATALFLSSGIANAAFSIASTDDIKATARDIAYDTMKFYDGNLTGHTPGILPGPPPNGDYYWWEAGALWGTMIDYWHLTGDATYNDVVMQAMLHQVGPNRDYMPPNYTASLGNDDQGFWGMSAMTAAENNFPNPPTDQPQWLALAQAVFNTMASPDRHDDTCGGGLRWQIPLSNNGYNYKNSIANGVFFNIGARLARYTKNTTYSDWAEKTWDWMETVGFIDADYNIFDGGHVEHNCTDINKAQFSYNNGVFLLGAANMYNYTDGDAKWKTRLDGLIKGTLNVFFPNNIAFEVACEEHNTCTTDMLSFKGYVARWMSVMTQIAPYTADQILPILKTSAEAGVKQCTGQANQRTCGFKWSTGVYDGTIGAGQQMNVLAAVSSLLIGQAKAPVSNSTGGTSVGDPNAGSNSNNDLSVHNSPITTADKAGAGILTFLVLAGATVNTTILIPISVGYPLRKRDPRTHAARPTMPIPDFSNTTTFPAFDALPIEDDGGSAPDAREEWFLVAQVKQNMTITKPTVVVSDRAGDEFAITFEDRGVDLRPVRTGWTIVVPRATRTTPREGKKGFVRVAEGRGTGVKYVPAGLERVFELGRAVREGGVSDGGLEDSQGRL